jgi:CheY-like chemotaxis protein
MRIIVADANRTFRNVVVALLGDDGHDVVSVATGGELVVEAKKQAPGVIITHVRFEDMSAVEAFEMLEASGIRVPAIITTGDPSAIPKEEAQRLGAVAVLQKPFSIEDLRKAVAAAAVAIN